MKYSCSAGALQRFEVNAVRVVAVGLFTAAIATGATMAGAFQSSPSTLPSRLDDYLKHQVELGTEERQGLSAGKPVTKFLDVDASKEVSVFGAVWIDAPIQRYVDLVSDIERFEIGGGFKVTKRISTPPRLEDFAGMHIPKEDLEELPECRVGDCVVKLGEQAIQRFQKEIDWTAGSASAAADALIRELAFEYVSGYLEGGNERLAVYRDHSRPRFVADEFREMIDQMPELSIYMPNVRRYLLEYPRATLPDSTSFLYWQETEFGLRPTFRISHLTIRQGPDETVVTSKMLYASHYFWTGLELRVLLPDPARGPGFWFVTVNRSRSDGLSGFTGAIIRRVVRGDVQDGTLAALESTKRRLEAAR